MDAIETIRGGVNAAHTWFEGTCADLTSEQENHRFEGFAHPISELAAHIVQTEDFQQLIANARQQSSRCNDCLQSVATLTTLLQELNYDITWHDESR